jgi:ferredoxin
VRITPDYCTQCRLCEHSCPFGAIREPAALPANPAALAPDRRRLAWLLVALPVLVAGGAWGGLQLAVPASKLHPTVALAEQYLTPNKSVPSPGSPTPESRALARAEVEAPAIISQAADIRQRVRTACAWFGGWVGLVIGVRLISLSLRATRTDFEPDRGACFACGRCYLACPNERVRLGLISPAEAAGLNANLPATARKQT